MSPHKKKSAGRKTKPRPNEARRTSARKPAKHRGPKAAELSFFGNLFTSIAEEMGVALARTAYSPNIKERRDFSCALFTSGGELVAQAAHIPVHLGALPASMHHVHKTFKTLQDGDAVVLNDPYAGGTHLPDITMVTPCFAGNKPTPVAYLVTRAHHADVGGTTPGSLPVATEIYQEGLRLPPVKLYAQKKLNRAVMEILLANVRTPEERQGDLRAQRAAHDIGTKRLREACAKFGHDLMDQQGSALLDYGERLMRAVVKKIPNGTYRFKDYLDGDGISTQALKLAVTIRVKGDNVSVDFEGTDPACAGNMNAVEAVTQSAVYYCFLCLLATPSHLTGGGLVDPPLNAGCFRPVEVVAPAGSLVNARPPSAVGAGNVETSQRMVDVVFGALAHALPDVIPAASQGTMNNVTLGGIDPRTGKPFAYYETMGGGMGARPSADGMNGVHVHMTNTMNTPVEALEYAYPLRVHRYALATGRGGEGRWRGGQGLHRDVEMLCDVTGTLLTERREHAPYGLKGGKPGSKGKNAVRHGKKKSDLPPKATLDLKAGEILEVTTPGGGGLGRSRK